MATTHTGANKLNQRILEIKKLIAERAKKATDDRAAQNLWAAANQWAVAAGITRAHGVVTGDLIGLAMGADALAAEGGFEGPWFAQELVKMAEPTPKPVG